jgi:plastocyanin
MSRRISLIAVAAVAAVGLVVALFGGSATSHASGPSGTTGASTQSTGHGQVLRLGADPSGQLRFTTSRVTVAKPGKITLVMTNPSSTGMDPGIAIDGNGVDRDGPIVGPGNTSTVTVNLKQGTYTYYCPVPGHRQAGMTGTLTVK